MRTPTLPKVLDVALQDWLREVNRGLQGDLTPFNLHAKARRQSLPFSIGSLAGGETFRIFTPQGQPALLEGVYLTSGTATSGSTSANNWSFNVTVAGATVNGGGKSTASGEIFADAAYSLGIAANTRLVSGQVVKLTATKNGTPTSLATAQLEAHVVIQLLE